jgi:hypothetical protein
MLGAEVYGREPSTNVGLGALAMAVRAVPIAGCRKPLQAKPGGGGGQADTACLGSRGACHVTGRIVIRALSTRTRSSPIGRNWLVFVA